MDPMKKKEHLQRSSKKYKSMDPMKKKELLETYSEKYKSMDPMKKKELIQTIATRKATKNNPLLHDLDNCISRFQNKIKEGPFYICSVCNRLLYRKSVVLLPKNKYTNANEALFTNIKSFDDKEYICKTCHSKILKGKIPCQAIYNNMYVDKIPTELSSLEKLEQILIA